MPPDKYSFFMKSTIIALVFFMVYHGLHALHDLCSISENKIADLQIGDTITNCIYPMVDKYQYTGDGYVFFEKTFRLKDSCSVSVGFNAYLPDTTTIYYLSTTCNECRFGNGIHAGMKISELLKINAGFEIEVGYGPELYFSKISTSTIVRLWIDNETEDKYLLAKNKEMQSKVLVEGYISGIEIRKN